MKTKKMSGRMKAKRNRRYNRLAMVGISLVVCMLLVVLLVQGISIRQKIAANDAKQQVLAGQIEEENARTQEIEELQEYMDSDEYIEKVAKEKIGLVKENEIIFKESE